ncbi:contactin-like [Gigantopelta aegis]|uniref:contactin-like n=1 Tax=Gigantopelta aegis TaxID=1735272 RepID=UPI001B88CA5E|nr:contactin-like [Gigantopelta aegis]
MVDWITAILVLYMSSSAFPLYVYDCPLGWELFEEKCYHFVFYPERTYGQSTTACQINGASLLSINTRQEHSFISQWLETNDKSRKRKWWTSGIGANENLRWEGDATSGLRTDDFWVDENDRTDDIRHIVYEYSSVVSSFGWGRESDSIVQPSVCEISLHETYRIVQAARDHTYGTSVSNTNDIPRGPKLTITPSHMIVVSKIKSAFIECAADGNPPPYYTWFRKSTSTSPDVEITSAMNTRYTLTNGKLSIAEPNVTADGGDYQCIAFNRMGVVMSDTVQVSFGYLSEFSNDPPGSVRAQLYQGTVIACNPPNHNPAVRYQWYKNSAMNFVRPEMNHYLFISHNGKLYFSETQQLDAGNYHCVVTLTAPPGQKVATTQPPSRTSLGIQLVITGDTASDFGPTIHNDFPAVFPSPPLKGEDIRLECMAYGRLPLYYWWTREGLPLPEKTQYLDRNRVLLLPDADLEDGGKYTCHVRRGTSSSDSKTIQLVIEAKPYFVFPLQDQHVDIGSRLSWRCEAAAKPRAAYTWYKDAKPLTSQPGTFEINENVLIIDKAAPERHSGMYQCGATNRHGTTLCSAQLRVLGKYRLSGSWSLHVISFPPTFIKRPVVSSQLATINGNATIICQPEAAPQPEILWRKDNRDLGLTPGSQGRIQLLPNGNLLLTEVNLRDAGYYECEATNMYGSAKSGGHLEITEQTTIDTAPSDTRVVQNGTAFFFCQASYDVTAHDLVYVWKFNDKVLNVDDDSHLQKGSRERSSGLYIRYAQFRHAGKYECTAQTVQDSVSYQAILTVLGPPGEPAGVYAEIDGTSATIIWTPGTDHGSPVHSFMIEYNTNYNHNWRLLTQYIPYTESIVEESNRRKYTVTHLSPGSLYSFRVTVSNSFGRGTPSVTSPKYKIPDAPPVLAPPEVGGGGGPVGSLVITWAPLAPEDHHGEGTGYRVYWRKYTITDSTWQQHVVEGRASKYTAIVGVDNFFSEYEVKVAAFNYLGQGPNSTITVIMSAEDMPICTPSNVYGDSLNGTAIMVFWGHCPDTREMMKGRVLGYQINFNLEDDDLMNSISHYGQMDSGNVIGLLPDSDYWVNVQVFNTAGYGPRGELARISTFTNPPLLYPEYVEVSSYGAESVLVSWRGISTALAEEAIRGYKLRYWESKESILTAKDVLTKEKETRAVISGIEGGVVYNLRVLGWSNGGDGKKSPTVYFTLGGQIRYDPLTSDILAKGSELCISTICLVLGVVFNLFVLSAMYD